MTPTGTISTSGRGLLLVLSGPSGSGKTSITRAVEQRLSGRFSVSATTRKPGVGEVHGRDYYFIDEAEFESWIRDNRFLEYAKVFGRSWYGTPRLPVEEALRAGHLVILDIDVQGALQVRGSMPDAYMIFITAPSEDELRERLMQRGRDDLASIQRRLSEARREIDLAKSSGAYDLFVVNDDLPRVIDEVCAAVENRLNHVRTSA